MLRFLSFGSGSSGNCYYLESNGGSIIIDAGIGIRTIRKYFSVYGINQNRIHAIFITHDHTDHIAGVSALAMHLNVPVYATSIVHERINTNYRLKQKIPSQLVQNITKNTPVCIGDFTLNAFDVPHDSADCSGYSISSADGTFVIVTDCGNITSTIINRIREADYLVLETNYDPAMLQNGKYPYYLKKRILSSVGHLSNEAAADLLRSEHFCRLNKLFLCHLSENNNTPEVVNKIIGEALRINNADTEFHVLARKKPTGFFDLEKT